MATTAQQINIISRDDPRSVAALEAEKRCFDYYGLDVKEHFVEIPGVGESHVRLRVLDVGAGEPILMVPGGAGEAVMFAPIMAQMKGRRFVVVNRPGAGLSDYVDQRRVDFRRFAVTVLTSVMDSFGLDSAPVIGNSMGGLWGFWLALDRPTRVTKLAQLGYPALILENSPPIFMRLISLPVLGNLLGTVMVPKSADKIAEGLKKRMGSRPEQIAAIPRAFEEAMYRIAALPNYKETWVSLIQACMTLRGARPHIGLAEELRKVQQPTLLVWGDNDPFGGLDVAREAVKVLPDARLHAMRSGHLPFVDEPAECAGAVLDFLSE
jgi:pimeloyl-ACP methyl ester carboxylesterase